MPNQIDTFSECGCSICPNLRRLSQCKYIVIIYPYPFSFAFIIRPGMFLVIFNKTVIKYDLPLPLKIGENMEQNNEKKLVNEIRKKNNILKGFLAKTHQITDERYGFSLPYVWHTVNNYQTTSRPESEHGNKNTVHKIPNTETGSTRKEQLLKQNYIIGIKSFQNYVHI